MEFVSEEETQVLEAWTKCTESITRAFSEVVCEKRRDERPEDFNVKSGHSLSNSGVDSKSLSKLVHSGLFDISLEWLVDEIRKTLLKFVVPKFNELLRCIKISDGVEMEGNVRNCLVYVSTVFNKMKILCEDFEEIGTRQKSMSKHAFNDVSPGLRPYARFRLMFDSLFFKDKASLDEFLSQMHRYLERKFSSHYRKWKRTQKQHRMLKQRKNGETDLDDSIDDMQSDSEDESSLVVDMDTDDGMMEEMESGNDFELEEFGHYITSIGWTGLLEECFTGILYKETENRIQATCKDRFEKPLLEKVASWLYAVALPWLRELLGKENTSYASPVLLRNIASHMGMQFEFHNPNPASRNQELTTNNSVDVDKDPFGQWKARLEFHVFETFFKMRMGELFSIVTEFPDSAPALDDLKVCLSRTHQHTQLVASLRHAFAKRLLHPGANTAQILDVYISTIKALRLLDSTGVLLEAISEPIKEYLRKREDTVRCIVTSLTNDSNSELFEELGRGGDMRPIEQGHEDSDDEDAGDPASMGENWTPDPIEADPRKTSRSRRSNDILSMLVHIYGSKELFVNEYRLMLADKLLSNLDFDTDREVRNLELLKLRFGESSMHNCEIMVKDVADSKRINSNIATTLSNKERRKQIIANNSFGNSDMPPAVRQARSSMRRRNLPETQPSTDTDQTGNSNIEVQSLGATVISKQFWPTLHGDPIKLHPIIEEKTKIFAREYSVLKNPRQLVWKTNLGTVQIELEFEDNQTKSYTVSPLLSTLIMHVSERESWTLQDLANEVKLDSGVVEKRMAFWVNQGVVEKSSSKSTVTYKVVEKLSDDHAAGNVVVGEDEAAESAVSADTQLAEEMAFYESYVIGMLNNFESLPGERIHNMLKMFVPSGEHKYDKTLQELCIFLNKLVSDETLAFVNGSYQIKGK